MTFVTEYVGDTSGWEEWYADYRFGVVLIFPPAPVRSMVNELRGRYDPKSQATCDAHISLTVPIPRELTETDCEELQAIAAGHRTFVIHYGPIRHYLPAPGVVYSIQPGDTIDKLRIALEGAACFQGARPRSYPFSPHMTIAEFITVARTEELMKELVDSLPQGEFRCESLSLAVPDQSFHFDERRRFDLAR